MAPSISRKELTLYGAYEIGGTITVDLRIWAPASASPQRGTLLFGSGGNGETFISDDSDSAKMFNELAEIGFRVIDRKWNSGGWTETSFGHRLEASRYATLVKYLHRIYKWCPGDGATYKGPLIVIGHSGGSAEIAYGLTTYGLDSYVDLAVLASGPAVARLDKEGKATSLL